MLNVSRIFVGIANGIAHAVLSKDLEASEARGFISNHVVPHASTNSPVTSLSGIITPRGTEGGDHAILSPGADATVDGTHTAESNFTKATFQEERSLTMEEGVFILQSAGIRGELVFENEANGQTVTEVFRTFDTEAGTGLHTGFHREGIRGVETITIGVSIQILEARINDTVELNISSESRTGKSAKNGNCSKSLFHFDLFL